MSAKYAGGYLGAKPVWAPGRQTGVWSILDRLQGVEKATKVVSVAPGQKAVSSIELPTPCSVLSVSLSKAAWVVFYGAAYRVGPDLSRLVTQDPLAGLGVYLEVRTGGSAKVETAPIPTFVNRESPISLAYPMVVTNEAPSADVTVEVEYLPLLGVEF